MAAANFEPDPARLAANRTNARKSTGPRTEAIKARSRANAVKHGLTGAGIALPGEDGAAIEAAFLQVQEEFAPTTLAGMRLVRDMAMIQVRQDRARRFEMRVLDQQARRAEADHDQARADRADGLVDAIEANPRACRRALLAMPEGVDRLVDALAMLLEDLTAPASAWSEAHHERLDALFGFRAGDLPWNRPTRFSRAVLGDYAAIGAAEVADVAPQGRRAWAIGRLVAAIGAEVAWLGEHRAAIDVARLAEERAAAIKMAELDPGREGASARRHVAAAARDLSRALRDLDRVESRPGTEDGVAPIAAPGAAAGAGPAVEANLSPDLMARRRVAALVASFGGAASATAGGAGRGARNRVVVPRSADPGVAPAGRDGVGALVDPPADR